MSAIYKPPCQARGANPVFTQKAQLMLECECQRERYMLCRFGISLVLVRRKDTFRLCSTCAARLGIDNGTWHGDSVQPIACYGQLALILLIGLLNVSTAMCNVACLLDVCSATYLEHDALLYNHGYMPTIGSAPNLHVHTLALVQTHLIPGCMPRCW